MAISRLSNIDEVNKNYFSLDKRYDYIMDILRSEYHNSTDQKKYFKKVTKVNMIISVIVNIVLLLITVNILLKFSINSIAHSIYVTNPEGIGPVFIVGLIRWGALVLLVFCTYKTIIKGCCYKLSLVGDSIEELYNSGKKSLNQIKENKINEKIQKAINDKEEYTVNVDGNIGNGISEIRSTLANTDKKVGLIVNFSNIVIIIFTFALLLLFVWNNFSKEIHVAPKTGLLSGFTCIVAAAVIHFIQIKIGDKVGKFSKFIGVLMAIVYALVLGLAIKRSLAIPFYLGSLSQYNKVYIIVPLIQAIGIILTILASHYSLEIEKWTNGFEVPMRYGTKPKATKSTIVFRMMIAFLVTIFMCWIIASNQEDLWVIPVTSFLWYCANSILKPTGSYLYTFWGGRRSWANEFLMGALLYSCGVLGQNSLSGSDISAYGFMIGLSFVVALIFYKINDYVI